MGFFGSKKLNAEDHERSITLARRLSRMNEADLLREWSKIESSSEASRKRSFGVICIHIFLTRAFRALSAAIQHISHFHCMGLLSRYHSLHLIRLIHIFIFTHPSVVCCCLADYYSTDLVTFTCTFFIEHFVQQRSHTTRRILRSSTSTMVSPTRSFLLGYSFLEFLCAPCSQFPAFWPSQHITSHHRFLQRTLLASGPSSQPPCPVQEVQGCRWRSEKTRCWRHCQHGRYVLERESLREFWRYLRLLNHMVLYARLCQGFKRPPHATSTLAVCWRLSMRTFISHEHTCCSFTSHVVVLILKLNGHILK